MELVLQYSGLKGRRLIISLPYWIGMMQGIVLERLPENLFTLTRDQVSHCILLSTIIIPRQYILRLKPYR